MGNVSVNNSCDSTFLSWSPPFSLDVTDVDPDIWYSISISNVTDNKNPTAVLCDDCHNFTQPNYTFTTANPCPHHMYSFIVIPWNGAGQGKRSKPVMGKFVFSKSIYGYRHILWYAPSVVFLSKLCTTTAWM